MNNVPDLNNTIVFFGNDLIRTYNHNASEENHLKFNAKRDALLAYLDSDSEPRQLSFQVTNIPGMRESTYRDLKRILDAAIANNTIQETKDDIRLIMDDMWYEFSQNPEDSGSPVAQGGFSKKSKRKTKKTKRKLSRRKYKKSSK